MENILLVDDHTIIRKGIKMIIENFLPLSTIDEAEDGNSAFEKIKHNEYDIIILDVNMPDTDSFGLVSNILSLKPGSRILMFSMNAEEVYARRYLQLGARGYVSKTASSSELENAINTVLNNDRYIGPVLSKQLTDEAISNKKTPDNPFHKLSTREFEIVQHLINGESMTAICNTFNLQSSTVGTYKARILEKLNCKNIIEVNRLARVYNIIPQA